MTAHKDVIYLSGEAGLDAPILRGLEGAGLHVFQTRRITETLASLKNGHRSPPILIGDVQAGGLALLTLMREHGVAIPATVLFDHTGSDIHTAIQALQFGVREYLLASDPEQQREVRTRVLAEEVLQNRPPDGDDDAKASLPFEWDPVAHMIMTDEKTIRLSPIEGRIFDLLLRNRRKTVAVAELVERALLKPGTEIGDGVKLLRPHIVRLRDKFDHYPVLAHRVINMRGTGYMLM